MTESDDSPESLAAALAGAPDETRGALLSRLPHAKALGLRVLPAEKGSAKALLPYDPRIVGDPESGVIHGGAVTALLDTTCGMAVMTAPKGVLTTATLGLRTEYMRPAVPGEALIAEARCIRVTRHIAFVEAKAYHEDDPERPVARATGTFIIETAPKKPS